MGEIKSFLLEQLGLSPDLVLVLAGLLAHFVVCLLLQVPIYSAWGLLAPLGLGLLIEGHEIWDQYGDIGITAPGNDPVPRILFRHSFDVLKMMGLPALIVLARLLTHR